jgi:hypothetical protein
MTSDPIWKTPAQLAGLPVRHWKRRTGFTERGSLAQMIKRWLRLAWNQQQECLLGWGPNDAGQYGAMGSSELASYVRRNGLPPTMLAARTKPPTLEQIEAMMAKPEWRPPPLSSKPGHTTP